jgi:O-antigen ligase
VRVTVNAMTNEYRQYNYLNLLVGILIFFRAAIDIFRETRLEIAGIGVNFNTVILAVVLFGNFYALIKLFLLKGLRIPVLYLYIFLLMGYFCLSLFYSVDVPGSSEELARLITIFGTCTLVCESIKNKKDFDRLIIFYGGCVIFPMLIGMIQLLFFRDKIYYEGYTRVYGPMSHPGTFGDYLVLMLIFYISNYLFFNTYALVRRRRLSLIILFFIAALILLTYTRGSWLGLVIGSSIMIYFTNKKMFLKYVALTTLFIILLSPMIVKRFSEEINQPVYAPEGVVTIGSGLELQGSFASRLLFSLYAFNNMFMESPVIGKGIGSFYYHYAPIQFKMQVETHNDIMKLLSETGIIGAALYLSMYLYLLKLFYAKFRSTNCPRYKYLFLAGFSMTSVMLVSMFTNASLRLLPVQFYYWTFVGIIYSLILNNNIGSISAPIKYKIHKQCHESR